MHRIGAWAQPTFRGLATPARMAQGASVDASPYRQDVASKLSGDRKIPGRWKGAPQMTMPTTAIAGYVRLSRAEINEQGTFEEKVMKILNKAIVQTTM